MRPFPPDFLEFLKALNEAGVEYLVVGGWAVGFHGYPRLTGDLDVWVAASETNARKTLDALRRFGAPGGTPPEFFLEPGNVFRMGRVPMRIEIINQASGVSFPECYARRVETDIAGDTIAFIAREDLLANKKASGRAKDLADVEGLSAGD